MPSAQSEIGLYGTLQGVVNRDIKLENTLLDGSKRPLLKICDFGYSKNDKDSVPKSKVGTPGYTGEHDSLFMIASSASIVMIAQLTVIGFILRDTEWAW